MFIDDKLVLCLSLNKSSSVLFNVVRVEQLVGDVLSCAVNLYIPRIIPISTTHIHA